MSFDENGPSNTGWFSHNSQVDDWSTEEPSSNGSDSTRAFIFAVGVVFVVWQFCIGGSVILVTYDLQHRRHRFRSSRAIQMYPSCLVGLALPIGLTTTEFGPLGGVVAFFSCAVIPYTVWLCIIRYRRINLETWQDESLPVSILCCRPDHEQRSVGSGSSSSQSESHSQVDGGRDVETGDAEPRQRVDIDSAFRFYRMDPGDVLHEIVPKDSVTADNRSCVSFDDNASVNEDHFRSTVRTEAVPESPQPDDDGAVLEHSRHGNSDDSKEIAAARVGSPAVVGDNTMETSPVEAEDASEGQLESCASGSESIQTMDPSAMCPICLEGYSVGDIAVLSRDKRCNHFFHRKCLLEWTMTHDTCPMCRITF